MIDEETEEMELKGEDQRLKAMADREKEKERLQRLLTAKLETARVVNGVLVPPDEIVAEDRKNRNNFLTRRWTEEFQETVRGLRWGIQAEDMKYKAHYGTPDEVAKYLPLVRRMASPVMWGAIGKTQPDGSRWTFDPMELHTREYRECELGTCEDENDCTHIVTVKEEVWLYAVKHSVGNWECRGCLLDETADGMQTRKIRWCPKFLSAIAVATDSVASYMNLVGATNPEYGKCYAGLLHSECVSSEGKLTMRYKCDTCGFSIMDEMVLAKSVGEGEILTEL